MSMGRIGGGGYFPDPRPAGVLVPRPRPRPRSPPRGNIFSDPRPRGSPLFFLSQIKADLYRNVFLICKNLLRNWLCYNSMNHLIHNNSAIAFSLQKLMKYA
ncbi:hypothetical protein MtrunA17_Chr2g0294761 [Medicago truncatula]|nr:hypothetical protein MtrunA17_Chr2g0294761 [Medicago truncatula]